MAEHAKYSPSKLERVLACPGSVRLIEALIRNNNVPKESKPSSYALHGTRLHNYVHNVALKGTHILNDLDPVDKGLVIECLDYIDMLVKGLGHTNYSLQSEVRVSLERWGLPEIWGTADKVLIDGRNLHVDIVDWKFGSGVLVNAKENPQLMAYAAGAIGWPTPYNTITLHVFQPAIDHVSSFNMFTEELYEWVHGTLAVGIGKCMSKDPAINPGVEQCRWCEAANHCDTRFTYVQNMAQELFLAQKMLPDKITPESIAMLIKSAPLVESAIKQFKLFASQEIQHGRDIPGYKLVSGRSNRKWKDEKDTIDWLANNTEIEEIFISKLVSPAQAEKLAKFLKKSDDFKGLWDKKDGKPTLVSEKDPRPALSSQSKAIDVFSSFASGPDKLE